MALRVAIGLATLAVLFASSGTPAGERGNPVQSIYTLERRTVPRVEAAEYRLKDALHYNIFAVPERSAVGTNSLNNAITVLDLSGGKVKYREVRSNFKKYVSGGEMVFLPEFSRDTIGYSQTRGFLLFNVKTGEFASRIMVRLMEQTIEDVAVLDWDRQLFLLNVQLLSGLEDRVTELSVVDLSSAEPIELASFEIKEKPQWAVLGRTTFYFTRAGDRLRLHALDENLKPTDHPLLKVYNEAVTGRPDLPSVHPHLPIALFTVKNPPPGKELVTWAVAWGEDKARPRMVKLFADNRCGDFRFSPDGKWVLFADSSEKPNAFFVMQVTPELPQLFGSPILLKAEEPMPDDWNGNCAWISDPVSVVCAVEGEKQIPGTGEWKKVNKILKWELSPTKVRK